MILNRLGDPRSGLPTGANERRLEAWHELVGPNR